MSVFCRLLPDISSLGLDDVEAGPIQNSTTSTPIDDSTHQSNSRRGSPVKDTSTKPRVAGKKSDQRKMSRDASNRPNKIPSVEPATLSQSNPPTMERDNPPPLTMHSLLEGGNVKVRQSSQLSGVRIKIMTCVTMYYNLGYFFCRNLKERVYCGLIIKKDCSFLLPLR